jgi:hypothetical protein
MNYVRKILCFFDYTLTKIEEYILDSLSFKQLSMACIEICIKNVWLLKIKSVIGASTLYSFGISDGFDYALEKLFLIHSIIK